MRHVTRRQLLMAAGALLAQSLARAQQPGPRVYRVAILHTVPPFYGAFLGRMRELGYIEGQNLLVDIRASAGEPVDRLPAAATEVASRRPDVIVAGGGEFVLNAIKDAALATPIVMVFVDFDPLATGHVASLSHPGGNVTGVYLQHTDLAAKRLELLKEAVPSASRIAVLFDFSTRDQLRMAQAAASNLGVTLLPQELRGTPYDYEGALRAATREKANAVLILSSGEFFFDRFKIMNSTRQLRLPSIATMPFADAGPLLCYGPNFVTMFALAARYADRILKGEKPADLAIEQPTRFELVVNLKTAKELGVTIPGPMLRRADEVIR
jgi:putative ABC transport system substrate-binding protein